MKNVSSKNRAVRALLVTGVAGASLLVSGFAGSAAESRPMFGSCSSDYCTPDTRPEIITNSTTTVPKETTTTAAQTTTTMVTGPTTTMVTGPTTTMAPGSTSTTAPRGVAGAGAGVAGAGAARPIAARASYAG